MTPRALPLLLLLAACGENRTFPTRDAYTAPTLEPLSCVPNLDGKIDVGELQAALGIPVRYLVNPAGSSRPVNVAGATTTAGTRDWDLATDYADDQVATVQAEALGAQWFASHFAGGQWVAPLDLGGRTLGVYSQDTEALSLHGYASPEEAAPEGKTLVVYAAPVALYRFPLEVGKSWVAVGTVSNATLRGIPYAGRDTYQMKVDAAGQLELPDLSFTQVLRVRTTTTIEAAVGQSVTRRQVGWLFECYGEVARAAAPDGETADDFTQAAELRRLGF